MQGVEPKVVPMEQGVEPKVALMEQGVEPKVAPKWLGLELKVLLMEQRRGLGRGIDWSEVK